MNNLKRPYLEHEIVVPLVAGLQDVFHLHHALHQAVGQVGVEGQIQPRPLKRLSADEDVVGDGHANRSTQSLGCHLTPVTHVMA